MFDTSDTSPSLQMDHTSDLEKGGGVPVPKSWFVDPYSMIDHLGLGYRASPSNISFETLRNMSEREPIIASIINTRVHQVASFCQPQPNKYSIGFKVVPRNKHHKITDDDRDRMLKYERLIMNSGRKYNRAHEGIVPFVKKIVRDSLTYDQVAVETIRNSFGEVIEYFAVPAKSIRIASPIHRRGTPPTTQEARSKIRYCQIVEGAIAAEYTDDELVFGVRNPRTDLEVWGYGFSELEMLIRIVTALLWGVDWNVKSFSQGATIKGILNMKGNIPQPQFEAFKRQWMMQTAGVANAWKTPMVNTDGIEWMPLQLSNNEMGYQQWLEFLIKVASAVYLIDPAEINFDGRAGSGQAPMFMSTNESQQKVSKDRGLRPLLHFISDIFNRYILWPEDDRYEFLFVGLDAKTEEQAVELRLKQVQIKTLNEVRAEDDLPPVKDGDIVLNPTYTGYLGQKAQQAQMGGAGGAPGGMPGGAPGGAPPGGAPGQSQQPRTAFPDKFKGKPFEDEERDAGAKMEREAQTRDDETVVGPKEDQDLHTEDWETTIHASLRSSMPDLLKALKANSKSKRRKKYDTVDV